MANSDRPGSVDDDARQYQPRRDEDVAVATAPITPVEPAPGSGPGEAQVLSTAPVSRASGPSFLLMLLGGFLAGAIGYLAAYYTDFSLFGTSDDVELMIAAHEERLDQIETALGGPDETSARLSSSEEGIARLQQAVSQLGQGYTGLEERLAGIEGNLSGLEPTADPGVAAEDLQNVESAAQARSDELSQQVAALRARLDGLVQEMNADTGPSQEVQALQERVETLTQQLSEQDAAIADAREAALREARSAAVAGAIAEVRAAVESGAPFADALGTLQSANTVEVPETLSGVAPSGVATLAGLQERFPDAARAAFDAALSETAGDGPLDRFGAFLKAQTGARSLGEREGDSADAVLSRAEARISEGDLGAALSELEALPEAGRSAMSDWIDAARTRLDAQSAAANLIPSPNSN